LPKKDLENFQNLTNKIFWFLNNESNILIMMF